MKKQVIKKDLKVKNKIFRLKKKGIKGSSTQNTQLSDRRNAESETKKIGRLRQSSLIRGKFQPQGTSPRKSRKTHEDQPLPQLQTFPRIRMSPERRFTRRSERPQQEHRAASNGTSCETQQSSPQDQLLEKSKKSQQVIGMTRKKKSQQHQEDRTASPATPNKSSHNSLQNQQQDESLQKRIRSSPRKSNDDCSKQVHNSASLGKQSKAQVKSQKTLPLIKSRRKRTGVRALEEIRRYQKSVNLLIPRTSFIRVVKEILKMYHSDLRVGKLAVQALQEAAETYITNFLEDAYLLALHSHRVTLLQRDIQLARRIRGKLFPE